jgi:hypothetical protein
MDHVDVGARDGIERPRLVLAVFEFPLFMRAEGMGQQSADIPPKIVGSIQREQPQTVACDLSDGGRRPHPIFHRGAPLRLKKSS